MTFTTRKIIICFGWRCRDPSQFFPKVAAPLCILLFRGINFTIFKLVYQIRPHSLHLLLMQVSSSVWQNYALGRMYEQQIQLKPDWPWPRFSMWPIGLRPVHGSHARLVNLLRSNYSLAFVFLFFRSGKSFFNFLFYFLPTMHCKWRRKRDDNWPGFICC